MTSVAAIDLGAESGRVTHARFDGRRISIDVVNRFANRTVDVAGRPRWDVEALWSDIRAGLLDLGSRVEVASAGVDSWGVDYGLLRAGELVEPPPTYRDPQRHRAFTAAMRQWGPDVFHQATGAQTHEINGVYSLLHDVWARPGLLASADRLLMIPDLFHHRLSGNQVTEYTAATTSGLYDIARGTWATGLADRIGVPGHLLPEVVPPGTDVGPLLADPAGPPSGLTRTRVIVPAAHDTASAIVAIPDLTPSTMFLSSGTWSLAGVLLDRPVITGAARGAGLTNEGGYGGGIRVLRDIAGLWLLQECRRQWNAEGTDIGYPELAELAAREQPLHAVVDVDSGEFLAAGDMPARIRAACARTGMPVPETVAQVARVVVDSLALAYRRTLHDIEAVTGTPITAVAVVGGGVANRALQQATASATGRPVTCWSAEGTALGNAAVQLASLGEISGRTEISRVVAASSPPAHYHPVDTAAWAEAAGRLHPGPR